MALFWRIRTVIWVALFLESCALYLILSMFATLARFEQLRMPIWLVMIALVWGYLLSSWILGLRITPVLRGLLGVALGVPSLLVLTAWSAGEALQPFQLLISGGLAGIGMFVGSILSWLNFGGGGQPGAGRRINHSETLYGLHSR